MTRGSAEEDARAKAGTTGRKNTRSRRIGSFTAGDTEGGIHGKACEPHYYNDVASTAVISIVKNRSRMRTVGFGLSMKAVPGFMVS